MNFEQYVLDNADKKYSDMYTDSVENPIRIRTELCDYSTYDKKRLDYNNRLSQELRDYNNALESIIEVRNARIKREEDIARQIVENEKERRFVIAQVISTLLLFLPVLLLLVVGLIILVNPIGIFKLVNFWIIIVIYALTLVCVIIVSIYILKHYNSYVIRNYDAWITKNYEYGVSLIIHNGKVKAIMLIISSIIATLVMAFGMINVGNLTVDISSVDDFVLMKNLPGAGRCDYQLKNDIDCHGKTPDGWGSIEEFSGILDGNNHVIKNIKYTVTSNDERVSIGLVKKNHGMIKNVSIEDSAFDIKTSGSVQHVDFGVLAATQNGYYGTEEKEVVIENCRVRNVYAKLDLDQHTTVNVGGIVGYNSSGGCIKKCEVSISDRIENDGFFISVDIEDAYQLSVGGIVGNNWGGILSDCVLNNSPIDLLYGNQNDMYVGGIIGRISSETTIERCVVNTALGRNSNGDIYTSSSGGVLVGKLELYSHCKVSSKENYVVNPYGIKIVGNQGENTVPGVSIMEEDVIYLDKLYGNYNEWIISESGYPTPCTGFDNN